MFFILFRALKNFCLKKIDGVADTAFRCAQVGIVIASFSFYPYNLNIPLLWYVQTSIYFTLVCFWGTHLFRMSQYRQNSIKNLVISSIIGGLVLFVTYNAITFTLGCPERVSSCFFDGYTTYTPSVVHFAEYWGYYGIPNSSYVLNFFLNISWCVGLAFLGSSLLTKLASQPYYQVRRSYRLGLRFQTGFTLIELLVVIAIIGLIISVVIVSVNDARKKGRDAKRVSDLRNILTATQLYYADKAGFPQNNILPGPSENFNPPYGYGENEIASPWECHNSFDTDYVNLNGLYGEMLDPLVKDGYIAQPPKDPRSRYVCTESYSESNPNNGYAYFYRLNPVQGPCIRPWMSIAVMKAETNNKVGFQSVENVDCNPGYPATTWLQIRLME